MFIFKRSYCNFRRRHQLATTFLELMLVISIISVIAIFIVNRLKGSRDRAHYQQCRTNLGELAQCMENYKTNEVFYFKTDGPDPVTIGSILSTNTDAEKWLHHLHCPTAVNVDADEYLMISDGEDFTIWCSGVAGKRHRGYPRPYYSTIQGGLMPPDNH